ncbi:MAG: DUF429 domain-containing protein [Acidimicrobiia bacterium]|nr:DUF429 domain-containing protein [Acidimicrobiia bacterium]
MYLGLDLAWSAQNLTGACALDGGGRIVDERMLGGDDEIIDWIDNLIEGPAVVAIDAPLHVPNETGRRPCESELHRVYGSRKAGPHSSNRTRLLGTHRAIRGEELATRLGDMGFGDPWSAGDRTLLEVYPHPAIIEVFGLDERLIYKSKRGVTVDDRRHGLRTLSDLLDSLSAADPPLIGASVAVPDDARGAALKQIEDRLDARLCAWVASVWGHHRGRVRLFGDSATGHIAVPIGRFGETSNP